MVKLTERVTWEMARELRDIIIKLGDDNEYLIQTNGGIIRAISNNEPIILWLTNYKPKYDIIRAVRLVLDPVKDENGRILKGRLDELIYENANWLLYDTRKQLYQLEKRRENKK